MNYNILYNFTWSFVMYFFRIAIDVDQERLGAVAKSLITLLWVQRRDSS